MNSTNRINLYLYSLPLLLLMAFFIVRAVFMGYSDFASYYFGSKLLLAQNYRTVYDTSSFNLSIQNSGFLNLFVSYTPFPPFTSIFFAPFTLLPIEVAKILFNILSCSVFLWTVHRSIKYFNLPPTVLLVIPLIFFTPIRSNLYFGQSYLILLCLLVEGYIAYEKKQLLLSSVLWAIAILFKIFPILIILFLLLKKEYKTILYVSGISILLLAVSLIINGFSAWKFYLTELFPRLNNGELNNSFTYIFQSAFMLLKNIFIYNEVLNPTAPLPGLYLFCILLATFKALIIGTSILITLKKELNKFLIFSVWITASLLISPNGSTYSQVLLLIPLLALFRLDIAIPSKIILAGLVIGICNVPVHYFADMPLLMKFPRLYFLIGFWVFTILLVRIRFDYRILAGCLFLFLSLESFRLYAPPDYSTYFGNDHKHLMVYNYEVKENNIIRYYWSVKGGQQDTLNYEIKETAFKDLAVKENQLYYKGKQITETRDWKRNPMLINGEYILYLSDKDRGIGFFTLRKIKLPKKDLNCPEEF